MLSLLHYNKIYVTDSSPITILSSSLRKTPTFGKYSIVRDHRVIHFFTKIYV